MLSLGMRLPRKSWDKTRTPHACVWCVLCDLMNYCVNGMLTMLCDEIVYMCLVISTWMCRKYFRNYFGVLQ